MSLRDDAGHMLGQVDAMLPFSVPLVTPTRGVEKRHGLLLHGPYGWGEWSPFDEYSDRIAAVWLLAALEAACCPPPHPVRDQVTVNALIPPVAADRARELVARSGCTSVKVKVAGSGRSLDDDVALVAAVRSELGPEGKIRVDANGAWSLAEAVSAIHRLEAAAGGLEYVEQPCATLEELAAVRDLTGVLIAADESIRRDGAAPSSLNEAVDVAVVKVQPIGGVSEVLAFAASAGVPIVVSSALETSVGLAAGVRAAASLPSLPFACGLGTALLLAEDVVDRPLTPVSGAIALSEAENATSMLIDTFRRPEDDEVAMLMERLARSRVLLCPEDDAS